jgi:hypothetical protein
MKKLILKNLFEALQGKKPKTFLVISGVRTDDLDRLIKEKFKSSNSIDFYDQPLVGDISVILTKLQDRDVLILKNLDVWSADLIENASLMLEKTFSERQIHLELSSGKFTKIDLENFHIVVTCNQIRRVPEVFLKLFDEIFDEIEFELIDTNLNNSFEEQKLETLIYDDLKMKNQKNLYLYRGEIYGKSRLVLRIISDLIQEKNVKSIDELEGYFPSKIQGSRGCFTSFENATKIFKQTGHKRYFIASDEILIVGKTKIAICNQWGDNFSKFLRQAGSLGFVIKKHTPSNSLVDQGSSDCSSYLQPEDEINYDDFSDMPLTFIVKSYIDSLDLGFGMAWEDDRTFSQFSAELDLGDLVSNIFLNVNEVNNTFGIFCYLKSLPKIDNHIKSKIDFAIKLIHPQISRDSWLGTGEFKIVEDDGSITDEHCLLIRFNSIISETNNPIDGEAIELLFGNAIRMVRRYSGYFSSIIIGQMEPQEAFQILDFSNEDNNTDGDPQNIKTRHHLTVSFRREESYIFQNIQEAKNFENTKDLNFVFHPNYADDDNQTYHIAAASNLTKIKPETISITRSDKIIYISAEYIFKIEVDDNCDCDAFDDWANNSGGWSGAWFEPVQDYAQNEDFEISTYFGTRSKWGFTLEGNENYGGTDIIMINGDQIAGNADS